MLCKHCRTELAFDFTDCPSCHRPKSTGQVIGYIAFLTLCATIIVGACVAVKSCSLFATFPP